MQLVQHPNVIFVGYQHPHPIKHHILLRIQTSGTTATGRAFHPRDALRLALDDLAKEVLSLEEQVQSFASMEGIDLHSVEHGDPDQAMHMHR